MRRGGARRFRCGLTLGMVALAAGACSDGQSRFGEGQSDPALCAAVPAPRQETAENAYQQAIQRDECIHRWAYRLARAPDEAEAVVGAVIGACRAQINRSASMLGEDDPDAERFFLAEMERVSKERALYRVIQARAGKCR